MTELTRGVTEQPAFCRDARMLRFYACAEASKVNVFAIVLDVSGPCVIPRVMYTEDACRGMPRSMVYVFVVLFVRRISQICPAIARAVAVFVVDLMTRPYSGHVQPRDTVLAIVACVDTNVSTIRIGGITAITIPSGTHTGFEATTTINAPLKYSSAWIVMQQLSKTFCGKLLCSHEALLSLIGQRPVGVRSAVLASSLYASQR